MDWNREAMIFNEPYFETKESNVTAPLGGTAYLTCRIRNLADRSVSAVEVCSGMIDARSRALQ